MLRTTYMGLKSASDFLTVFSCDISETSPAICWYFNVTICNPPLCKHKHCVRTGSEAHVLCWPGDLSARVNRLKREANHWSPFLCRCLKCVELYACQNVFVTSCLDTGEISYRFMFYGGELKFTPRVWERKPVLLYLSLQERALHFLL
jgi:hypothetical protein